MTPNELKPHKEVKEADSKSSGLDERSGATRKLIEQANVPADLVFEFFAAFSRFEYALKRARFLEKKTERKEDAQADWSTFGSELAKLPPDVQKPLLDSSAYLRRNPPKKQIRTDAGGLGWKERTPPPKESEIQTLMFSIRTARNNLFHGGKFPMEPVDEPGRNEKLIQECVAVLNTLLAIEHSPCSKVAQYFQMDV